MLLWMLCSGASANAQAVRLSKEGAADKNYDLHLVAKGETLYSISKAYHTSVAELLRINAGITEQTLPTGSKIKVPVAMTAPATVPSKTDREPVYYTIQKKETLYAISKKFDTKVDSLMRWNQLQDVGIEEGALLIVGYEEKPFKLEGPLHTEIAEVQKDDQDTTILTTTTNERPLSNAEAAFPEQLAEKGIATWVKSTDDGGDFFALHPTAPKDTEVKVKNMMNGKVITVRVIGKLPATSANENIIIKISGSAAKALGVLDDRFLVAVYYDHMEEDSEE